MRKKYSTVAERKAANLAANKRYRQTEKGKAADKRYRRSKKGRAIRKVGMRKWTLKPYNMIPEEYNQKFIEQNGQCAICGRHQSEFKKSLAVDHNRETGVVRELLCINCNTMIGSAKHSIDCLQAAIDYLEKHCAK